MSEIIPINELYPWIKGIIIIVASTLFAASMTSCACAGLNCSLGGVETHKALNDRLVITKSTRVAGGHRSWEK